MDAFRDQSREICCTKNSVRVSFYFKQRAPSFFVCLDISLASAAQPQLSPPCCLQWLDTPKASYHRKVRWKYMQQNSSFYLCFELARCATCNQLISSCLQYSFHKSARSGKDMVFSMTNLRPEMKTFASKTTPCPRNAVSPSQVGETECQLKHLLKTKMWADFWELQSLKRGGSLVLKLKKSWNQKVNL